MNTRNLKYLVLLGLLTSSFSAWAEDLGSEPFARCTLQEFGMITETYEFTGFSIPSSSVKVIDSAGNEKILSARTEFGSWITYKIHFQRDGLTTRIDFSNYISPSQGTQRTGNQVQNLVCELLRHLFLP